MIEKTISREFIKRWGNFYGRNITGRILRELGKSDPRILAPNTLYTSKRQLQENLENQGFRFATESPFNSLILDFEPFNIVATTEYLSGLFTIQSLTSLIPSKSLNPSHGSVVADLAASPGIKTCLLAELMKNTGTIYAIEKAKKRIPALKANLARMGIYNTVILNGDARSFPDLNIEVDHILLDAPCTGTGLKLRKNKRLERRVLNDVNRHAQTQREMLEEAWKQLKNHGTIVYSTCSLEPEEGEVQINNFIARHEGQIQVLPIGFKTGIPGNITRWNETLDSQIRNTRRIFPDQGMDGFFIALMEKVRA
ncbi:MAG: RsmB/NOP family class I SAM-dependent RNA methyltransferase [Candidatus Hodarchaeales archaeon]|jgi:NOL1/NOP2/sun family putative RNA methylase